MSHFVYIVACKNGSLYTGYTTNVEKRLDQHNGLTNGGAKYTKMHRPVFLAHIEEFDSKSDALKRECEIKTLSPTEKRALIASKNFEIL